MTNIENGHTHDVGHRREHFHDHFGERVGRRALQSHHAQHLPLQDDGQSRRRGRSRQLGEWLVVRIGAHVGRHIRASDGRGIADNPFLAQTQLNVRGQSPHRCLQHQALAALIRQEHHHLIGIESLGEQMHRPVQQLPQIGRQSDDSIKFLQHHQIAGEVFRLSGTLARLQFQRRPVMLQGHHSLFKFGSHRREIAQNVSQQRHTHAQQQHHKQRNNTPGLDSRFPGWHINAGLLRHEDPHPQQYGPQKQAARRRAGEETRSNHHRPHEKYPQAGTRSPPGENRQRHQHEDEGHIGRSDRMISAPFVEEQPQAMPHQAHPAQNKQRRRQSAHPREERRHPDRGNAAHQQREVEERRHAHLVAVGIPDTEPPRQRRLGIRLLPPGELHFPI
ncbi:MAG: hypothetical protein BWY25_00875 [Chloroflexi bacterium ADurb.Bin222]|nr:MAG: hypothetical protein BWY25_00875 [Chloroflexi bacterium ADurb.Bin222]